MNIKTYLQLKQKEVERRQHTIDCLSTSIVKNPSNWKAYLDRGEQYLYISKYEAAISDYTQLIDRGVFLREAYIGKGHAESGLGNKLNALEDYSLAIQADSTHIHAYYLYASIQELLGDREAIIDIYDRFIAINSKNSAAYHNRASAKEELGRYAEAILDYTKSIELDDIDKLDRANLDVSNSGCLLSYFHRGNAKLKYGDRQGAIEDYTEVITFRAITTDDLMIIGKARRYKGDREGAIRDFTKTIAPFRSCSSTAHYEIALTKLEMGDRQGAIDDANLAINFSELSEGEFDKNLALKLIENIRLDISSGKHSS